MQQTDDHAAEQQPEHACTRRCDQPLPQPRQRQSATDPMRKIVKAVAKPTDVIFVQPVQYNLPADLQHRGRSDDRERTE